MISSVIQTIKSIFKAVDILDWDQELNESWNDQELGINNPYSKIACLIIYLYSIDFGTQPIYAEVNRAIKDMEVAYVMELGPYLKALSAICDKAELNKSQTERIPIGFEVGKV